MYWEVTLPRACHINTAKLILVLAVLIPVSIESISSSNIHRFVACCALLFASSSSLGVYLLTASSFYYTSIDSSRAHLRYSRSKSIFCATKQSSTSSITKVTMSSNIENVKHSNDGNNNDNLPPDGGGHGNVLGQRTNLPALATDQPYKPVTGTDGGTQDSGYRTGSTSGTAFFPASASSSGPASATLVSTTSSSAATEDSASASPSAMTTRGRHARHEAQDLGRPHTGVGAAIDLARIDENQPRSSSTHAYRHYGKR